MDLCRDKVVITRKMTFPSYSAPVSSCITASPSTQCVTITFQSISYIYSCFTSLYDSFTLIKGKLTVQVTSKDLVFLLQQSGSQCVYVGPTCKGQAITAPPPSPLVPVSLPQGLWWLGRVRGHCCLAPDSYAPARVSHGSDLSKYDTALVIFDRPLLTIGETPLQVRQSRRQCSGRQQRWVGGWGRGGNQRVGNHMCE